MPTIPGHHHISMLTKNSKRNFNFYQQILGLRLVKKTVNQDEPSMYHLFYGDRTGSPGTALTFFEMPMLGRTVRGTNAITRIGLLVPTIASLDYWKQRFDEMNVKHGDKMWYAGREVLPFEDEEGLRMMLIPHEDGVVPEQWTAWEESTVDPNHRILGMGTIEITVRKLDKLAKTLTELFGYTEVMRSEHEAVYQAIEGQVIGEIAVKEEEGPSEKPGRGSIHHVAIRVHNDEELQAWEQAVQARGFSHSGIVDRYYFKSLYFRESNGILFELATDGPGFTSDSSIDKLGKSLDLPSFLEERRAEIEANLHPLD